MKVVCGKLKTLMKNPTTAAKNETESHSYNSTEKIKKNMENYQKSGREEKRKNRDTNTKQIENDRFFNLPMSIIRLRKMAQTPIKRLSNQIKQQDPIICCL